jgi:hypothetical protein
LSEQYDKYVFSSLLLTVSCALTVLLSIFFFLFCALPFFFIAKMSKLSAAGTAVSNDKMIDVVHVSDESDAEEEGIDVANETSHIPNANPSGGGSSQGAKKVWKRKSEV